MSSIVTTSIDYHNRVTAHPVTPAKPTLELQIEVLILNSYLPRHPGRLLDAGCGFGYWDAVFLARAWLVAALDNSHMTLRTRGCPLRAPSMLASVENLPFRSGSFDVAYAQGDVVSYADHPLHALAELRRVVRFGGCALVSVDNRTYRERRGEAPLPYSRHDGIARFPCDYLDIGVRFPTACLSPAGWSARIRRAGWEIVELFGKGPLGAPPVSDVNVRRLRLGDARWLDESCHIEFLLRPRE